MTACWIGRPRSPRSCRSRSGSWSRAQLRSNAHFARGAAALARGDAKAAAAHFAACNDDDTYCQWCLLQAQEKAGDAAAADATRRKLLAANRRDGVYLVVRSQLAKEK